MKRFVDTEIFEKEWFMDLEPRLKVLTQLIFLKCDAVGVWDPNWKLASFYVGEKVTAEDLQKIDHGRQFEVLEDGKVFIPDFCKFQYGELRSTNKPHLKYISMLKEHGLLYRVKQHRDNPAQPDDTSKEGGEHLKNNSKNIGVCKGYARGMNTPEEKEKEKEKEKEENKGGARGKEAPSQNGLIDPDTGKIPHRVAIPKLKENRRWREQTLTHLKNMFGHHLTQKDWEAWIDRFFQEKALEPDHERDGIVAYQKWFVNWLRVQLKYQSEKKAVGQHHAARRDPWVDEDGDQLSAYGTKQKNLPYMKRV